MHTSAAMFLAEKLTKAQKVERKMQRQLDKISGKKSQDAENPFVDLEKEQRIRDSFAEWTMPKKEKFDEAEVMATRRFKPKKVRHRWIPPAGLRYDTRPELLTTLNAWAWAPPAGLKEELPFYVFRAGEGQNLPVYTEYKARGTQIYTVLRKYRGDSIALMKEVSTVCSGREVRLKNGSMEVAGNFRKRLKYWLISLGF
uniref:Large ribosomal subunit protein mL49 n=1 Tax=Erythrolobus australicus TaxID=1077150 RepID=A0A7S1TM27_9RHOD